MFRKTVALAALAAAFFMSACSQNETAQPAASAPANAAVDTSKTYIVATDASYAPMEYMEGEKVVGFSHDILDAAAKHEGVKLQFVNVPFDGLFVNLGKGDSDIALASITITDERKKQFDFSDPYFQATQVIITTDRVKDVKSFADLKNRTASVQSGTSADLILQNLQGKESRNIKRFDTMPLAFQELESGGVDSTVGDSSVVDYYISQHPESKLNRLVDPSFVKEKYGFAFRKDRGDNLRDVISKGLAAIKADGTYAKIYRQWFGSEPVFDSAASAASAAK